MTKSKSALRQLVLCVCDQDDLTALERALQADWAGDVLILHPAELVPDIAAASRADRHVVSRQSDLIARHGYLCGLTQIEADLKRAASKGRTAAIARVIHCPTASDLALMEAALERSARQAIITVGGHCLHLDVEEDGGSLFSARIATSELKEARARDAIVHVPGSDILMFDPDIGTLWASDVEGSLVSMRPASVAIANLLANRGIALIDFERAQASSITGSARRNFTQALEPDELEISRFSAFMFQSDLWNETRTMKRVEQSQCQHADVSLLRAAASGTVLKSIPDLEPVFAAISAQLGTGLNRVVEQSQLRSDAVQYECSKHGKVLGDYYAIQKSTPDFDQVPALPKTRDRIIFSVATYHKRVAELEVTLESIYDQADEIHVYLNDLETVPEYCKLDKITVYRGQDFANLSAAGKMYFLSEPREGYVFIIDDDNVLPPDYVEKMIRLIELYKRRVAVTVHGSTMIADSGWYYRRYGVHAYQRPLALDKFVNLPGSGTFAYHTDTLKLDFAMFQPYVLVDLAVAIACRNQGVPIICARRPEWWLKLQESAIGEGLWEEFVVRPTIHTPAMLENGPWDLEDFAETIMPIIEDVFGDISPEEMMKIGLDADFLTKVKAGEQPFFWSAANSAFSVTGTREKDRLSLALKQSLEHADSKLTDEETAQRYDRLLTEAFAKKDLSAIDKILVNLAVLSGWRFQHKLGRSKKEWAIAQTLRDFVHRPSRKGLGKFFEALWGSA